MHRPLPHYEYPQQRCLDMFHQQLLQLMQAHAGALGCAPQSFLDPERQYQTSLSPNYRLLNAYLPQRQMHRYLILNLMMYDTFFYS